MLSQAKQTVKQLLNYVSHMECETTQQILKITCAQDQNTTISQNPWKWTAKATLSTKDASACVRHAIVKQDCLCLC